MINMSHATPEHSISDSTHDTVVVSASCNSKLDDSGAFPQDSTCQALIQELKDVVYGYNQFQEASVCRLMREVSDAKSELLQAWTRALDAANENLEAMIATEREAFNSRVSLAKDLVHALQQEEAKIREFKAKFPNLLLSSQH
ncbi:hypothetical protein PTSG_05758 [Salpingoeca rosetta]|uniref:Biogenesis of lysosome-related organelles complex 1 subunit 5 n=1 Tax=Salpingoeca rosetta (strain ATCC 50818 / BSB-021) TaxID=946362 RepID=F2UB53_SALR5|nr:uncharacterized protein PTSG_05758 [Salpingoeca rosetta]EGD74066.1 hypothetical protein PTSG_05758 [Salpingoeca rosetta]|eukprot:XP_004993628.1 hypothetical protein PTSG_05758 [Salpingoeca rosetta]